MSDASEDNSAKSQIFFRRLYGGGTNLLPHPHHGNVGEILGLCGCISLLVFNISLANLTTLLILRLSFQQCRWIFADWSKSKVKKWKGLYLQTEGKWGWADPGEGVRLGCIS